MIDHWMKTANHGPKTAEPIYPRIIVLHDTEAEGNSVDYLSNNNANVSVQYVVDRDGAVYRIGRETWACWHAGRTKVMLSDGLHIESANRYSIGIEIAHQSHIEKYPAVQLRAVEDLVLDIYTRWPIEHVYGHRDVCYPLGRKTDPELKAANYTKQAILKRRREEDDMTPEQALKLLESSAKNGYRSAIATAIEIGWIEEAVRLNDQFYERWPRLNSRGEIINSSGLPVVWPVS